MIDMVDCLSVWLRLTTSSMLMPEVDEWKEIAHHAYPDLHPGHCSAYLQASLSAKLQLIVGTRENGEVLFARNNGNLLFDCRAVKRPF